jgi:molybdopterin-guanine dinucleotide biosynthesis adapter protein
MSKKVLGLAGFSGSGKTTLLEKIIPLLVAQGLRIAVIKHTHHDFSIDQTGTDSHRHRVAGASEVLLASGQKWALLHEVKNEPEPSLDALVERLSPCDLVLVEGYKQAAIAKLEVHRSGTGHAYLYPQDAYILALVSDEKIALPIPVMDLNEPAEVVEFIVQILGKL